MFAIKDIIFDDAHLSVVFQDGTVFRRALKRYNRLLEADTSARKQWTLNETQDTIIWSDLGSNGVQIDLYELVWEDVCNHALGVLQAHNWDVQKIMSKIYEVVALWRLEADGYNGGFLQFFCNWGEDNCQTALKVLQTIGAQATYDVVMQQRTLIQRLEDSPEMIDLGDLPSLLTEEERDEIGNQLDHELWDAMEELPRLAIEYYGWADLLLNKEKSV